MEMITPQMTMMSNIWSICLKEMSSFLISSAQLHARSAKRLEERSSTWSSVLNAGRTIQRSTSLRRHRIKLMVAASLSVRVNALMGLPLTETHPFTFVVLATQLVPHVQMMDSLETTLSVPLVSLVGNFMLQSKNVWKLAELATTK